MCGPGRDDKRRKRKAHVVANDPRRALQSLLISSRLTRNSDVEEREGVKSVFKYNATIESFEAKEEAYFFAFVVFKVEKQVEDKSVAEFNALYLVGYEGAPFESEEAEYAYWDSLIDVSAWPRFRDLFEMTVAQAELDFPRLPTRVGEISKPKAKKE